MKEAAACFSFPLSRRHELEHIVLGVQLRDGRRLQDGVPRERGAGSEILGHHKILEAMMYLVI